MCKNVKIACEKLSADYVSAKTKKPFERIYTVVLNHNASGKRKENIKTEAFKKGIPYLVWASNINKEEVFIREVSGGKTVAVQANDCLFTHADVIEINGRQYKETAINGIFHYLPVKNTPTTKKK